MATPETQQRPRKRPPEQAQPVPEIGASAALGVGTATAAIGTAAGTAAGVAAMAPAVAGAALAGYAALETAEEVAELILRFLVLQRAREERWIVATVRPRGTQADVLAVVADENARAAEYQRRVLERVRRDAARIFAETAAGPAGGVEPGPGSSVVPTDADRARERANRVRGLLQREQTYARQRSEAMAIRSLALTDRLVLRRESPSGAFWKLDPTVQQHTIDCIMMGGRFWPWEVLDDFHPPTHTGCRCSLHGYAQAVAAGWLRPGQVMDVATARRLAAAAKAHLHEDDVNGLLEALGRTGLIRNVGDFDRALRRAVGWEA